MRLRMWTYDLAREQAPTLDHLRQFARLSVESGYNAWGIYLEHRFAYPSTPWAHGAGALQSETIRALQGEFPELQIVPFVNLLGHFEGMLYTEHGKRYRETVFGGLQACPSCPEFRDLCVAILNEAMGAFDSEIVHLGGDETRQLGECPRCQERVAEYEAAGHVDGRAMLYTEHGKRYRETVFAGLQACPSCPEFRDLCVAILNDAMGAFDSEIVHLGGDETRQLGKCPRCQERVAEYEAAGHVDGRAMLYAEHFAPLIQQVVDAGRRPALWADMFHDHPSALDSIPSETLLFDWQYFDSVQPTAHRLRMEGFNVVACPTLHTYNSAWLHVHESESNIRQHIADAHSLQLEGVCLTTWECGLFGAYDSLFPAIRAAGKLMNGVETSMADEYGAGLAGEWSRLLGSELPQVARSFAFGTTRSSLRVRFLLHGNPFLAWLHHGEELAGPAGDRALEIVEKALHSAPSEATKDLAHFLQRAIEFVRIAERARTHYSERDFERAIGVLSVARNLFDELERVAKRAHARIGGSLADIERCRIAKRHVETVIQRIRDYGDGSLGYVPAFEHITHQKFVPHDQGAWWLINRWADS